jgi:hypothetical protein
LLYRFSWFHSIKRLAAAGGVVAKKQHYDRTG